MKRSKNIIIVTILQLYLNFLGMGKITALDLAKRGAKVILACMNLNEAEEAKGVV